jgi:hypothetical protein
MSRSGAEQSAILNLSTAVALVNAKRSGVPTSMITAASACRAAGDWRGACRAAGFDVRLNPDEVRRRYGTAVSRQLLDDLRHFAPDGLRWQLPRQLRDGGRLQSGLVIPLAEYAGGTALTLAAITPPRSLHPRERVVLALLAGDVDVVIGGRRLRRSAQHRLVEQRRHWDVRESHRLRAFTGRDERSESITRLQDQGAVRAAWAAAGIDLRTDENDCPTVPTDQRARRRQRRLRALAINLPVLLGQVAGLDRVAIRPGAGWAIILDRLNEPGRRPTAEAVEVQAAAGLPVLPEAAWARPVEVELLRRGLIGPDDLHPLMARALGHRPAIAGPVRIEIGCSGSTHRIARRGCLSWLERERAETGRFEATQQYRLALAGVPPPSGPPPKDPRTKDDRPDNRGHTNARPVLDRSPRQFRKELRPDPSW